MANSENAPPLDPAARSRGLRLLAVVAVTAAGLGLIFGAQPPEVRSLGGAPSEEGVRDPAVRYQELRGSRRGPNGGMYEGAFSRLRGDGPKVDDPVVQSPEQRKAVLKKRAERRAYAGAPPTVPHSVQQKNPAACLACHGEGAKVADKTAPQMSHKPYSMCTQCHAVERQEHEFLVNVGTYPEGTEFEGAQEVELGERYHDGAPPQIPHSVFMRENCSSCHGTHGALGMRSTHPARKNCKQCHAASAEREPGGPPPFGKWPPQ